MDIYMKPLEDFSLLHIITYFISVLYFLTYDYAGGCGCRGYWISDSQYVVLTY